MTMSGIDQRLLPDGATVSREGRLAIAGCDVLDLAEEFGTPVFVYDEQHLRDRCREAVIAFGDGVAYAAKAFLCMEMARLAHEEGMHLDVATGGELRLALAADVPPGRLVMHGNNKSSAELRLALESRVGRIVVDSFEEIDRIESLVGGGLEPPAVLIRVNPGIDAHTHEYLRTGAVDSKFGFGLASGAAADAVDRASGSAMMRFKGLHAHIGSQVFETSFFERAIEVLAPFVIAAEAEELSIGGGLGVPYVEGETAPTITEWAAAVRSSVLAAGITSRLLAEPGRAVSAAAAVTLYTVGTIKEIEGVRTYVAVDGGMSDNPRPVLYGSGYEAFLPRATTAARRRAVRIVGKHCESGDIIVHNALVPDDLVVGDVLCTPVTGAYGHSMGSNYNVVRRPPVVFVKDGTSRLVIRRETYDDLFARDVGFKS